MNPSPQQQIEAILQSLKKKGMAAAPVEQAMALAHSSPAAIRDLAVEVMQKFPRGGTFLDGALSYLPADLWPALVAQTLDIIDGSEKTNDAAESVIAYASLQAPAALHPHLDRIFALHLNGSCYYAMYPWRESGDRHFDFLRNIVENDSADTEDRQGAWEAMLQTRSPRVLEYAATCAARRDFIPAGHDVQQWTELELASVGFQLQDNRLQRLCPDALFHLIFPADYFDANSRPPWLARVHPTWNLPTTGTTVEFGGVSSHRCALCRGTLHRLLAFAAIPAGLDVSGVTQLELATCLSCLGWQQQPLFYQHDSSGTPSQIAYDGSTVEPEFPAEPLKAAQVQLAVTPARWRWQDWALSNSRENLSRLGGEPCWVQNAEYPQCPTCGQTMHFLLQLDSNLPTQGGGEWLWGSGGIGYGFWCDGCKVSALHWQCT